MRSLGLTISDEISRELANEIVAGKIRPGTKLDERGIADRFEVSRSPVRDALRQLATTGLIEIRPRRGVTVVDIGVEQLSDMFDAMGELEALCARLCAHRINELELKKLETLQEESADVVARNDIERYSAINEDFHGTIYKGARNKSIEELVVRFRRRLSPFRTSIFFKIDGRMKSSFSEHQRITEAMVARDAERAHKEMRQHVVSSSFNVINHLAASRTDE